MSMFFLEIDTAVKKLRWVRAGHEPSLFYDPRRGAFEELSGPGLALGVVDDFEYKENSTVGWTPGTVVVIGTDGIHETRSPNGEMFGKQKLRDLIATHAAEPAESIQNAVLETLRRFQGAAAQEDDITLVVVKLL